jgi:RNA polymerase sigma-70 factor (ECF subfamily)
VHRAIDLGKRRARDFRPTVDPGERIRDVADVAVATVLVRDALGRLAPKLRAVIVLRFYEDLTLDEIAGVLRVPIGTAKSRLSRGLDDLERFIEGRAGTTGR